MLRRLKKRITKHLYGKTTQEVLKSYRHIQDIDEITAKDDDYSYIVHYKNYSSNPLSQLCDKYGSDKGSAKTEGHVYNWVPHTYADFYHHLFGHCRTQIKAVFECGLGSNNVDVPSNMGAEGKPGASLRAWKDYFVNAEIYGADVDRDILFTEDHIQTFHVDQTDGTSVEALWRQVGPITFDLMIDDGLHTFEAGVCLYKHSIARLSPGGFYVIEDVTPENLDLFRTFFSESPHHVSFINLIRPNKRIGNNSLVLIRKPEA